MTAVDNSTGKVEDDLVQAHCYQLSKSSKYLTRWVSTFTMLRYSSMA
jgi:hypothetical protein